MSHPILSFYEVKRDAKNNSTTKPTKADKFKRMNASLDQKIETKAELKSILNQLTSKIDVIEKHVDLNLNKLDFLSDVTPKT